MEKKTIYIHSKEMFRLSFSGIGFGHHKLTITFTNHEDAYKEANSFTVF
jgi:hypothetical protein